MSFGIGTLLRYDQFEQVGEGAYGHVYKARDKQQHGRATGQVALKKLILPPSKEMAGFPVFALREITFLKRLRHPNIVTLLDIVSSKGCEDIEADIKTETLKPASVQSPGRAAAAASATGKGRGGLDINRCGSTFLVFEYVEHDLSGLIDSRYPFDPQQCRSLSLQLMRALAHLQERRIMHRDVKSSNVLITNSLVLKLADFGMARQVPEGAEMALLHSQRGGQGRPQQHPAAAALSFSGSSSASDSLREDYTNNVCTIWYRPPEILLGETKYLWNAVDVWSAGCVLAELELLRPLFPGKTVPDQLGMIMDVMGAPTEAHWAGVSLLPHFASLVLTRTDLQSPRTDLQSPRSFRAMYEELISEDLLTFLDRLLVLCPDKRLSPRAALQSSKYLQSFSEKEVRPLGVGQASLHEFQTKRSMRLKRDAEKKLAAAARAETLPPQTGSRQPQEVDERNQHQHQRHSRSSSTAMASTRADSHVYSSSAGSCDSTSAGTAAFTPASSLKRPRS